MTKVKSLVVLLIMTLLILVLPNITNATNDITIMFGNDNQWIQFPSSITKSFMANWDGYYTYNGTINKITTSENVTFQIQYYEIEKQEIDEIQAKSDQTSNDEEFYEWLNNYMKNKISDENWKNLTNMKIDLECIKGQTVEHEHIVFVKASENNTENIIWQGYGEGFARISESRKKVTLESIEITIPPTKTDYEEGELFNKSGMVITAKYSDGTSKVVDNYTYTPKTALNVTDTAITIVYTENDISKEVTQEIKVKEKVITEKVVLEKIEITTAPTKIEYKEGELFDKTEMVITAKYSDGTSKVIDNYTYTPKTELKKTDTKITITYVENDVTKEVIQEIKVQENPDPTTATQKIPAAGLKVTIVFAILATITACVAMYSRYKKMSDI